MDEFVRFNLYECSFWILLGVVSYVLNKFTLQKYSKITVVATAIFILFGLSDYVEVKMGGFLYPIIWWLLAWKIVCVIGMVLIIIWYLRLRLGQEI